MLVSFFENLVIDVKHRIGRVASEQTRQYRWIERLKQFQDLIIQLWSRYRIARIRVNLFEPEV